VKIHQGTSACQSISKMELNRQKTGKGALKGREKDKKAFILSI